MEVPSSSGTSWYTIEDDDVVIENIVIKSANSKMATVAPLSSEKPNDRLTKIRDIIERFNSGNISEKPSTFEELRACLAEKSLQEFSNLLFHSVSISIKEKNNCTLCQKAFNSSHENITHIILAHNVPLDCSLFVQMVDKKAEPKILKKNIVPGRSKCLSRDKLKQFLHSCNRARNQQTRIKKYALLKNKFKADLKCINDKILSNNCDRSDNLWICRICKKSYKQGPTLAKHLFVEHCFDLELEAIRNEIEVEIKVKLEKNNEDHKPENVSSSANVDKGTTLPSSSMDDAKKFSLFAVYLAKSFPVTNSKLLRELFQKLNYDISIIEDFTTNPNKFVGLIKKTISSNFINSLVNDVGASSFSIFIHFNKNEKLLLLIIKYHNIQKNRICTSFYRLIHVQSDNYSNQIIDTLKADGLNVEKCTGFGLDISYEDENSSEPVMSTLKNVRSKVAINRCIFRSLQLIMKKSCSHLPENLAIMIEEIYKWCKNLEGFSEHKNRFSQFGNIEAKTNGHEWFLELKFIKFIVFQWNTLKQALLSMDNCFARYILQNLYQPDENRIALSYIHQILKPVIDLHESFLKEAFEPSDLFKTLSSIVTNLYCKSQIKHEGVPNELIISIRSFIQYLVSELEKIIPEQSSVLHQMSFSIPESTKSTKRMQCLPFSNCEVARIIDHVIKFINDANSQAEQIPVETMEAFLIIRCQNETSFLDL